MTETVRITLAGFFVAMFLAAVSAAGVLSRATSQIVSAKGNVATATQSAPRVINPEHDD